MAMLLLARLGEVPTLVTFSRERRDRDSSGIGPQINPDDHVVFYFRGN
jgi:hypothetical protein